MFKSRHFVAPMATVAQLFWLSLASADDAAWVRVADEETDEILSNPGMGWEAFHWTTDDDKNLPAWIPSTVHFARWGWGTLEPEKGRIDYGFLDGILKETRESGQKLAFRAMCCSSSPGDQPTSSGGSLARYPVERSQKLLRLDCGVAPDQCQLGANTATVGLAKRDLRDYPDIVIVEKIELHVSYRKAEDSP